METEQTEAEAAEAAFQRMISANPDATVIGGGPSETAAAATPAAPGGWTFSSDLSPERLAEIQALIGVNGLAGGPPAANGNGPLVIDAGAEHDADAEAAFMRMVAARTNGSGAEMFAPERPTDEAEAAAREHDAPRAIRHSLRCSPSTRTRGRSLRECIRRALLVLKNEPKKYLDRNPAIQQLNRMRHAAHYYNHTT